MTAKCVECGGGFEPMRRDHVTCSPKCNNDRAVRKRRESRQAKSGKAKPPKATVAAEPKPLAGCRVCKRLERDGHDSWCSPERRAAEAALYAPVPSPITVRHTAPSYVEPVAKPKGLVAQSEATMRAKAAAGRQAMIAQRLADKLAANAAKKAASESRKADKLAARTPRPKKQRKARSRSKLALSRKAKADDRRTCETCGTSIAGSKATKRFCSWRCRPAFKVEVMREATRKRALAKAIAALGDKPDTSHVCNRCGIEKPGVQYGRKRNGERSQMCRECHGMMQRTNKKPEAYTVRACEQCGETFKPSHPNGQRWCSRACNGRSRATKPPKVSRERQAACLCGCGEPLDGRPSNAKYISDDHKWRHEKRLDRRRLAVKQLDAAELTERHECADCGETKPRIEYANMQNGKRSAVCRECHGRKTWTARERRVSA